MNKKLIISLVLIGVMAFGAGLGSYAWFSSTATSNNNLFETGTLVISVNSPMFLQGEFENIYPSWESAPKTYKVKNDGSLDLKYRMRIDGTAGDALFDGSHPLQVKINNREYVNISEAGTIEIGQIPAGQEGDLTLQFRLPEGAGDDYQGEGTSLNFVFEATQVGNPGWSEAGL